MNGFISWHHLRVVAILLVLPVVATAAASAHQMLTKSTPIDLGLDSPIASVVSNSRVHTVAVNRNGIVEGRIATLDGSKSGVSDLTVFFIQNGKVVKKTSTGNDGTFAVSDIAEGAYSFIATGENGFAAYGVNVVTDSTGQIDNVMEAAAVSPKFESIQGMLTSNVPGDVVSEIAKANPEAINVVGANRVRLTGGKLVGRVVPLVGKVDSLKNTFVHILRNNKQVAEVKADESGNYMVSDLEPGVYNFVASGPSGFAAVSFEAVQEDAGVLPEATTVDELVDSEELPASADPFVEPVATPVTVAEPAMATAEPVVVQPTTVEPIAVEPMATPYAAEPIVYQDSIPADIPMGVSDSLDVCLACQGDAMVASEPVVYSGGFEQAYVDQGVDYGMPIEYAGEAIGCGCASGGSCGAVGSFSGYSACNTCSPCSNGGGLLAGRRGGLLGGIGGGGGGLLGGAGGGGLLGGAGGIGRLALLSGLVVGIVAIADDDPQIGTPTD